MLVYSRDTMIALNRNECKGIRVEEVRYSLLSCGAGKCSECAMHSGTAPCKGCLPENGFKNMGEMWEVVKPKD